MARPDTGFSTVFGRFFIKTPEFVSLIKHKSEIDRNR